MLFDITNDSRGMGKPWEIYAYSMETELGGASNILTKAIYDLTKDLTEEQ